MTPEQLEWCQTLGGNCIQCKFQDTCDLAKGMKMERLTLPSGNPCNIMRCADYNCDAEKTPCDSRKIYDKLRFYEDAEEQGRILVLPCKVWDTVYRVITEPQDCESDGNFEQCGNCRYVDMPCDDVLRNDPTFWECGFEPHVMPMPFFSCMADMVGKTVFLTREAAEAALKEKEKDNG